MSHVRSEFSALKLTIGLILLFLISWATLEITSGCTNKKAGFSLIFYSETPAAQTDRKITEIRELRKNLKEKKKNVEETDKKITDELDSVKRLIGYAITENKIADYESAKKVDGVTLHLQVIQKAQGYKGLLAREIILIKNADNELDYLERTSYLDVTMLRKEEDQAKLNEMIKQMDVAIKKYLPQSQSIVTPTNITQMQPLEEIWTQNFEKKN